MFSCPNGERRATSSGFVSTPSAAQMGERRVHVQGVPEHHHVDHQAQRPELVLLALAVALADLATLAVEDRPRHAVAALTPVQLREDSPAIGLVIEVGQQVERLGHPPQLADRPRQGRGTAAPQQRADQLRGADGPPRQRSRHPQQVIPVPRDQLGVAPGAAPGRSARHSRRRGPCARTGPRRCRPAGG